MDTQNADNEKPWCPLCEKSLSYTGAVDTTGMGQEGHERRQGVYKCETEGCDNFASVVRNPVF